MARRVVLAAVFLISLHFKKSHGVAGPSMYVDNQTEKIICIGDSLTQGFYNIPNKYHPYTIELSRLLNQKNKHSHGFNKHDIDERKSKSGQRNRHFYEVVNSGVGGQKVIGEMEKNLLNVLRHKFNVKLAIILGGINDIIHMNNTDYMKLYQGIKLLHDKAHKRGIKSVVVTIPEALVNNQKVKYLTFKKYNHLRTQVNRMLRKYVRESNGHSILCDLERKFPLFELSESKMEGLWTTDNVHPTPKGYDQIGRIMFECIRNVLK